MRTIKQIDGYKIYMNQLIGQGAYGSVYIGISDTTGIKVAVKILNKSNIDADQYLKKALFNQIKIMEFIKSDNIVGLFQVMESSKNYYIVQQLCDNNLSSLMKSGQKIQQSIAKQYLLQMANGFLALVRQGIIHRDIKPANIMLKGNKIKIGDFGFAKKAQTSYKMMSQTIVGSPLYMPIQVLKSQSYSSKCDIWALGCIYYQMLHGYPPWHGKSQYQLVKKIQSKPLQIDDRLSEDTKDFLRKCLGITQSKRISWDELFIHPIFNGFFLKKQFNNNEYENKLKMIMSSLRFQINSKNINLCKVLAKLGYNNGKNQLNKDKFYQFLKIVHPGINKQASDYIFNKTDFDKNGTISINQIQQMMNQNSISISTSAQRQQQFNRNQDNTQSFTIIPKNFEIKIREYFSRLTKQILIKNKVSLKDTFNQFHKKRKNALTKQQFKKLLHIITFNLTNQQFDTIFTLIDQNNNHYIQFHQFNNYVNKISMMQPQIYKKNSFEDQMEKHHFIHHQQEQNVNTQQINQNYSSSIPQINIKKCQIIKDGQKKIKNQTNFENLYKSDQQIFDHQSNQQKIRQNNQKIQLQNLKQNDLKIIQQDSQQKNYQIINNLNSQQNKSTSNQQKNPQNKQYYNKYTINSPNNLNTSQTDHQKTNQNLKPPHNIITSPKTFAFQNQNFQHNQIKIKIINQQNSQQIPQSNTKYNIIQKKDNSNQTQIQQVNKQTQNLTHNITQNNDQHNVIINNQNSQNNKQNNDKKRKQSSQIQIDSTPQPTPQQIKAQINEQSTKDKIDTIVEQNSQNNIIEQSKPNNKFKLNMKNQNNIKSANNLQTLKTQNCRSPTHHQYSCCQTPFHTNFYNHHPKQKSMLDSFITQQLSQTINKNPPTQ